MLAWFRRRHELKRTAHDFYGSIVALSRQPRLFDEFGIPDSVEGRFEVLTAHMFLYMERLRREGKAGASLAQELVDLCFKDLDISNRELGVGDLKVPKKMRQLAAVFAARIDGYRETIEADDPSLLERRIAESLPLADDTDPSVAFADYLRRVHALLQSEEMNKLHLVAEKI